MQSTVYLPAGTWYDFWTHEAHLGPRSITVAAPLERLPLFVRAGAIIPFGPVKQYDTEPVADDLMLLIYPHGHTSFDLYEDDGRSNAYLKQKYSVTGLSCIADAEGCVCHITQATDSGRSYLFKIFAKRAPRTVILVDAHGAAHDGTTWWHDGSFLFVRALGAQNTVRVAW
jgi:alpha-glucosidase (family GH31 glycosyl hydrolase)